jgi:hypothetical protein
MAMNTAAEGARSRREERVRREKGRIKRKASAPHTKLEVTTAPYHQKEHRIPRIYRIFEDTAVYLRILPYIYRT